MRQPLSELACALWHTGTTVVHMPREVSVRELRNSTAAVARAPLQQGLRLVAAVRAGETLTLTVNHQPVADIVPHVDRRSPWVPAAAVRRMLGDAPADPALLADLADVRGAMLDDA